MFLIWLLILFYSYLIFIRRQEPIHEKNLRESFFAMFPHNKNGMWRWENIWLLEFFWLLELIFSSSLIFITIYILNIIN